MYCIMARPDEEVSQRNPGLGIHGEFTPLVCHSVFQDALEDQDVPTGQGMTALGNRRNIRCDGQVITNTTRIPYQRSDGRPIFQVTACANYTKKRRWAGVNQGFIEESDLGGFPLPKTVVVGAAVIGLIAALALG
jgi:hypothetical protein